jgi:hypothetical protein
MRKHIASIALGLALAMGVQGCYGSFALTRKVWKWNGSLGHGVDEAVFLVLNIIPVYGVAAFVDAIVLNSVEFWSGKNPMDASLVKGDKKMVMIGDPATGLVRVSIFEKGALVGTLCMKKTDHSIVAVDPKNTDKVLFAAGRDIDDRATVADASGRVLAQTVN